MAQATFLSPRSLGPKRLVANKFFTSSTSNVKITRRRRRSFRVCSSSNKDSYDGKLVDEGMIVLRLRIREIQMEKMKEEEEEVIGGSGYYGRMMEWERRYWQQNYASDICQAVGLLQNVLMDTRPFLALAFVLFVSFSLSFSMSLSLLHLVSLGKRIFMHVH